MRARLATLAAGLLLGLALAPRARAEELAVIVHPQREVALDRDALAQIFLKRRAHWEDGGRIVPVNRDAESPLRAAFTRLVFGESARAHAVYWNRQYYLGMLPPATLASDEAVKRFVASEPLAIGYIRADAVDASVHVVLQLSEGAAPAAP
jgi:ABC-type phosphate transport system substrate-binding protein